MTDSYSDRAISGASLLRPGIQELMSDAQRDRFDIVLSEALDRLSRDQEDIAGLYKRLSFAGISMVTVSEGEIGELHIGLKGTMNALFLRDLAQKIRRGQTGRALAGSSPGGLSYGYDVVREFDQKGEPIRGKRQVNQTEATVIRRIFENYVAGVSPRKIASNLNQEGVATKEWGMESLGNPVRTLRLPPAGKARDRRLKDPQGAENESEEDRLVAACSARAAWLGALVRLALATGMRQGELLALEWPHVDIKRRVAHLPDTKNGSSRDVPLSSAAIAAIKDMAPAGDKLPAEGRIFPYRDDKVRREFPKACKAAGITGLRFHDLRHEATSRLFEKGLNPMEAASVTGHKTLQMLKRYTHLRAEDLAKRLG